MTTYPLDTVLVAATQRPLVALNQELRALQLRLLDNGLGSCPGCRAYNLTAVAVLNQVRLMLRPLALDFGVSAGDRHAVALHVKALLQAVERGDLYHEPVTRLLAIYRFYYRSPQGQGPRSLGGSPE